jgi:hypothetical protein
MSARLARRVSPAAVGAMSASTLDFCHLKSVVFHDVGDIRLAGVTEPKITPAGDAIAWLTVRSIRGPKRKW